MVEQPVCIGGCCLNPGFIVSPQPPQTPVYCSCHLNPGFISSFTDTAIKLTSEEKDILFKLGEAYNIFCSLDNRSGADNLEFTDAVHRLQQLIALRVARRANPEVWAQPE